MIFNYAALKWVRSDAICWYLTTILDEANVQSTTASTARSVPRCGCGSDAGLRPHLLCQKASTVLYRLAASVKEREQPDAHESGRDREQCWRGVREQRAAFRIAQGGFPHRRRHDCEQHR